MSEEYAKLFHYEGLAHRQARARARGLRGAGHRRGAAPYRRDHGFPGEKIRGPRRSDGDRQAVRVRLLRHEQPAPQTATRHRVRRGRDTRSRNRTAASSRQPVVPVASLPPPARVASVPPRPSPPSRPRPRSRRSRRAPMRRPSKDRPRPLHGKRPTRCMQRNRRSNLLQPQQPGPPTRRPAPPPRLPLQRRRLRPRPFQRPNRQRLPAMARCCSPSGLGAKSMSMAGMWATPLPCLSCGSAPASTGWRSGTPNFRLMYRR